jgi:cytochrome oxidase Cu insertion factor (SCO1/SenC/PrrC family)
MSQSPPSKSNGRLKMLFILLVCATPVFVSYFMYYVVKPEGRTNYGTLLTPPVDAGKVPVTVDGKPAALDALKGKWLMVTSGPSACDATCVERLYLIRQVRETTGKEKDRVTQVWLVTDNNVPSKEITDAYPAVKILRIDDKALNAALPTDAGQSIKEHIFVVDPLGNIILRFPAKPDPSKMKKDMSKLLRASRLG